MTSHLCNRCVRELLILARTWFTFGLPSKAGCDTCTSAVPLHKSSPVITFSPKLYNFLNLIPFLFSFIGECGAPPWPMSSDHLSGERYVLSADSLLPCALDSPLL
jgi:hypothetical protein